MKMILPLLFLLAQVGTTPTAHEAVERLRAKTPVEAVATPSLAELAGRYTTTSKELGSGLVHFSPETICTYFQMVPTFTASGPTSRRYGA